ncbi:MAG: hypothetical protein AB7F19_05460 [Candidatus Babeliales bacterium]
MKILSLTLLLLVPCTTTLCMDSTNSDSSSSAVQMIDRTEHDRQVAELQAKIQKADDDIRTEKLRHAQAVVRLNRRWDLKNAAVPATATLLIGLKTAYDVYTTVYAQSVPHSFDYSELAVDGAMLLYATGKTSWHLLRACCRKAKVE